MPTSDLEKQETDSSQSTTGASDGRRRSRPIPFGWNWYLVSMTTLGLSTLLYAQTAIVNFNGLHTIAVVVYLLGLTQFGAIVIVHLSQILQRYHSFRRSLRHSEEALFAAAFWISCYGIITGGIDLSSPSPASRLSTAFLAFFWFYVGCAVIASTALHLLLFHEQQLIGRNYTPTWLLPILPVSLVGVMAGSLAPHLLSQNDVPVLVAGLICSSMALLLSFSLAALYLHRLFAHGVPDPNHRPSMMVAIGPPSYTALAFLRLASAVTQKTSLQDYFNERDLPSTVIYALGIVMAIAVIGVAFFFFFMAVCAIAFGARQMTFHLNWYALVFPNVGLLSAIGTLGTVLASPGVEWVATGGTIVLVAIWIITSLRTCLCVAKFFI